MSRENEIGIGEAVINMKMEPTSADVVKLEKQIAELKNKTLDSVMPEIMRLCNDQIIVGNVVNFETVQMAIDNLKHRKVD